MTKDLFTIVKRGPGPRDPLGKPTTVVLSRKVTDGRLEQSGTAEGETFVVNEFRAFFPLRTDVSSGDTVEAEGLSYTVEGQPSVERIPGFPAVSNLTARLTYVGTVSA